jgi:hypothetical protein
MTLSAITTATASEPHTKRTKGPLVTVGAIGQRREPSQVCEISELAV